MPSEYTGFETAGYDADSFPSSKIFEIPRVEHQLNSLVSISPLHSDNAMNVFNKAAKDHNGKLVISVVHDEHPKSYGRNHISYSGTQGNIKQKKLIM
jgi:hypothetical protein